MIFIYTQLKEYWINGTDGIETMSSTIQKTGEITVNNTLVRIDFDMIDVPLDVMNSIRRAMSSLIPTVTFHDTWDDDIAKRSIQVRKNTSSLHNEFLSHRLSLLPINMTTTDLLRITTVYDARNGTRTFSFLQPEKVPMFVLQRENKSSLEITEVSTDDFRVWSQGKDMTETLLPMLFPHDPYTDEPILINKLKYVVSTQEHEMIDIVCHPRIGMGKLHSRHDPTGTSCYHYKKDTSRIEQAFQQKLEYMRKERIAKNTTVDFTPAEVAQLRKSFELLDAERIFVVNDLGEPKHFECFVESVGFLTPTQIVYDAISMLYLVVMDVVNSFTFRVHPFLHRLEITNNGKVWTEVEDNPRRSIRFTIQNENHTLGNLIANECRRLCGLTEKLSSSSYLQYVSYRMDHPLIEELDIIMVPNRTFEEDTVRKSIGTFFKSVGQSEWVDGLVGVSADDLHRIHTTIGLITTLRSVVWKLLDIRRQWSEQTDIDMTSWVSQDTEEYINNYAEWTAEVYRACF